MEVSSATLSVATQAIAASKQSERTERKENDGDSDDKQASSTQAVKPTVNSNGQTIGTIVNTKA